MNSAVAEHVWGTTPPHFRPIRLLEVDLGSPLPAIHQLDPTTGRRYDRAAVLIRLHTEPLGQISVDIPQSGISASVLANLIQQELGAELNAHLRLDGCEPTRASAEDIESIESPACLQRYEALAAQAPFVSVVVATRERPQVLSTCLDALLALAYPCFEVLVVDNAPQTDVTAHLISSRYATDDRVRYIWEQRPGLSWSRNRGIVEARGEIIAFTDDDVVVDHYWLSRLVAGFGMGHRIGCITGLVLPLELETSAQVLFEQFGGFGKGFSRKIFNIGVNRPASRIFPYAAGMFGSGNNMAFRATVLRSLGGFDPALGAGALVGGEDLDAFFRLVVAGYTLVYEPAAIVRHQHRRDLSALRRQLSDGGVAGYLTKHVLENWRSIPALARRLPHGLVYLLSPRSPKNARKQPGYPRDLTRAERRGMLLAPIAYLWGRRHAEDIAQRFGPLVVAPDHPFSHDVGTEGEEPGAESQYREAGRSPSATLRFLHSRADTDSIHGKFPARVGAQSTGDRLHILFVATRYFPSIGGVEVHTYEVARRMAVKGHQVAILTTDPSGALMSFEQVEGLHIHRTRAGLRFGDYYFPREIYHLVRAGRWDVIHCQGCQGPVTPAAMLAARVTDVPYVVTLHSGGHTSQVRRATERLQWALLRPLLATADRVIAVSDFEAARFRTEFDLESERVVVIPNGSNLPLRGRRSPVQREETVIASVGRLERYKGHHRVVAAMPHVLEHYPGARLQIVGFGPYERQLRRLVNRLQLGAHVEIGGISGYDRAGIADLLSRTKLVTLLSEYESQGLAITEAIAQGCQVLVARTSALASLIDDGLARGISIDATPMEIADAIVDALRGENTGAVPCFPTWDACVDRLIDLYRSIR